MRFAGDAFNNVVRLANGLHGMSASRTIAERSLRHTEMSLNELLLEALQVVRNHEASILNPGLLRKADGSLVDFGFGPVNPNDWSAGTPNF